jgi:dGTP triphosphohydrolase
LTTRRSGFGDGRPRDGRRGDVLERLVVAVESPRPYQNEQLLKIVPLYRHDLPTYIKLLTVTDFLSGMTDTYLRRIHRRLTAHAIL